MNFMRRKRLSVIILSIFLIFSVSTPGFAADIFVNGEKLTGDLNSAYAVGGGGVTDRISDTYAITASGTQRIDSAGSKPGDPQEAPLTGTVSVASGTIKVGLKYYYSASRDYSVETANLQNSVGSGYKFGYYDANRKFVELGSTPETQITMAKDTNVTVSAGTIGCYHVRLSATYPGFSAASSAASAYSGGFPAYYNGAYYVLVGSYTSQSAADAAAASIPGGTAYTASSRCVVVTKTGTTNILFEFDMGDNQSLGVLPVSGSGKAETWFSGYTYYGGFEYKRINGGNLTVINVVDLDDYVMGVVASEMSYSWPVEALKAQAVCARTYAARMIKSSAYYNVGGYDLTNDTYTQAYSGTSKLGPNIYTAIDGTRGVFAVYNGKLIEALYSSSSGGGTEDNLNVNGTDFAYLKGVIDPYEEAVDHLNYYCPWPDAVKKTFTASELGSKVKLGSVVSVEPTYSATGNVIKLVFTDSGGSTATLQRDSCRTTLGLPNIHYTVTRQENGSFLFDGRGWGHNVGMSQYGARAMAEVYGFNYRHIIGFYFTGVNLATGAYAS